MMKTYQVLEKHKIVEIEVDSPQIQNPFEVMVKIKYVGICGSDIHIYNGTNPFAKYPVVVGHEMSGEVVEIGNGVKNINIGDRVTVDPVVSCGNCYACKNSRTNVCSSLEVRGVHRDGGLQEFLVLPYDSVHKANPKLELEDIVLAEPFTIGFQATSHTNLQDSESLLIYGAGPIGLCILQVAILEGMVNCIVVDLEENRLQKALK